MAPRLIITGSTVYIGARLVAMARERGFDVVELGRRPGSAWRIGDEPADSGEVAQECARWTSPTAPSRSDDAGSS
ncbi:hypothetical protein ACC724_39280, partial [Rhizobium ruizarguesonis]